MTRFMLLRGVYLAGTSHCFKRAETARGSGECDVSGMCHWKN